MGHIHAELMAQYAEDAKQHDEPWKLWQHYATDTWGRLCETPKLVESYPIPPQTSINHGR